MGKEKKGSIVTTTVIRVSVVFILAIVVLTGIFSVYMWGYMRQNLLAGKEEQVYTIADTMESRIENLTAPIITLAKYNAALHLLTDYYEMYSEEWMQDTRNLHAFLSNVSLFDPYIIDIALLKPDATIAYSMNDVLRRDVDYLEQEWFCKALEGEQTVKYAPPHGVDHLYYYSSKHTFSAIYPVPYAEGVAGYILVECDLSTIAGFFTEQRSDSSGFILLDDERNVIFDYQEERAELEMLDALVFGEEEAASSISFQENDYFYVAKKLPSADWVVISENEYSIIMQPIERMLTAALSMIVLVLAVLVLVAWVNAKAIEKPFNALIERIVSYDGSSSMDIRELEHAPRELAVIGNRFEDMADKMNTLINDVYLAELSRKEMELEALINQINPHFIYNVFQLIQTKAVLADNVEIEDMIQKLSGMLRYTMERKRDKVEIWEEVDYISDYLMFYKARFSQMFSYEIICTSDLLKCMTPKFILQPVVENCFKHAFKNQREGGRIRIAITREAGDILFTVWDNGQGMEPEELEALHKKLELDVEESGIGIVNTNARIRLVYGSPYCLCVDSMKGEYTEVKIRIRYEA